jgi:hypothetical protein
MNFCSCGCCLSVPVIFPDCCATRLQATPCTARFPPRSRCPPLAPGHLAHRRWLVCDPLLDTYHVALIPCLVFRTCLLNTGSLHGSLLFIPRFVLFFHCCMPWLVCNPLPLPVAASIPLLLSAHFFSTRRPTPFDTPQSLEHINPSLL